MIPRYRCPFAHVTPTERPGASAGAEPRIGWGNGTGERRGTAPAIPGDEPMAGGPEARMGSLMAAIPPLEPAASGMRACGELPCAFCTAGETGDAAASLCADAGIAAVLGCCTGTTWLAALGDTGGDAAGRFAEGTPFISCVATGGGTPRAVAPRCLASYAASARSSSARVLALAVSANASGAVIASGSTSDRGLLSGVASGFASDGGGLGAPQLAQNLAVPVRTALQVVHVIGETPTVPPHPLCSILARAHHPHNASKLCAFAHV